MYLQRNTFWSFLFILLTMVFAPHSTLAFDLIGVGPGGGGNFTAIAIDPNNSQFYFLGTDVNGVFRYDSKTKSTQNISKGLRSQQIHSITIAKSSGRVFLGTSDGIYVSDDFSTAESSVESYVWTLKDSGFLSASSGFSHPVQMISIAPTDENIVWASLGESEYPENPVNRVDAFHIYKSMDGGETWSPTLKIPSNSTTDETPLANAIAFHPTDSNEVYVGSTQGLYVTYDAGLNWYELGRQNIYTSSNAGVNWQDCSTSTSCDPHLTSTLCSASSKNCLLVRASAGETHAFITDIKVVIDKTTGQKKIFAVQNDRGHASDALARCQTKIASGEIADFGYDETLSYYRGGPQLSLDNGLTWISLMQDSVTGSSLIPAMRCNTDSSSTWNHTLYNHIEVNPENTDTYIVTARYLRAGVFLHKDNTWHDLESSYQGKDTDFTIPQGAWSLSIDRSINQIGITKFQNDLSRSDVCYQSPSFVLTHSRGAVEGHCDDSGGQYQFSHLAENGDVGQPQISNLSDVCVQDVAVTDDQWIITTSDAGILEKLPSDKSWTLVDLPDTSLNDGQKLHYDEIQNNTYAIVNKSNISSILNKSSSASDWQIIGGHLSPYTGLPETLTLNVMNTLSNANHNTLFVGTEWGLYQFDATTKKWSQETDSSCSGFDDAIVAIERIPNETSHFLVSVVDQSSSATENGDTTVENRSAVYLYSPFATNNRCQSLITAATVGSVYHIAFAESDTGNPALLLAAEKSYQSVIFRSELNSSTFVDLNFKLTFSYDTLVDTSQTFETAVVFASHQISTLAVNPQNKNEIFVGFSNTPSKDFYVPQEIYESQNGGSTFQLSLKFDELSSNRINFMSFTHNGEDLFVAPNCGSLFYADLSETTSTEEPINVTDPKPELLPHSSDPIKSNSTGSSGCQLQKQQQSTMPSPLLCLTILAMVTIRLCHSQKKCL